MPEILIVDDNRANLVALEAVLESLGERIVKAGSGEEALRYLLGHEFSLVLLDVHMPGLSGFETAALIWQRERTRNVPIVFITATEREEASVVSGYTQGAVDYVVKPFDPEVLRAKVASLLSSARRNESLRQEAAERTRERNDLLQREQEARADADVQRQRLQSLFMHSPAAVAVTRGPQHVFTLINPRYQDLIGTRELLGKPGREALPETAAQSFWDAMDSVYRSGEPFVRNEYRVQPHRRGEETVEESFFNLVVQATRDARGDVDGLMMHGFDVTDQIRARRREEEAVRVRDEFLAIASHELRTPLTPLRLQLQATIRQLRRGEIGMKDVEAQLEAAVRQTKRIATLVNDLLEVSRISMGRLTLHPETMDLAEAAREVLERHEPEARNVGCALSLRAESAVGTWDKLRIDEVLANLLTNAIKYGAGQPVEVAVERADVTARLTVRDHGIGIPREDQERIFDRFERAVSVRSYGGMGLGLYVVRQIVVAHGGSIRVQSAPGQGSTFTVELPI